MPVIAVANSKGGSGKSTASLILGSVLARQGASVTLIDCDPNHNLLSWRDGSSTSPVEVLGDIEEGRFVPTVDALRSKRDLVVIDLEGTASRTVSRAIMRADLVLIPTQPSAMDARQASRAVSLVREEEAVLGRAIPLRVVLTRTSPAVPTRAERAIIEQLAGAGVPALRTHLHQRTAYQAMFAYGLTLDELDPAEVNGLEAARANAEAFATEVADVIRSLSQRTAA